MIEHQPVLADRSIFDGDSFPKIDFQNKELVAAAMGPYALTVRFFDAAWNEVQAPAAPGRYGAWIDIHFDNGATDHRQLTLFKTATPYLPAKDPYRVAVEYPAAFGISSEALARERWNVQNFSGGMLKDAEHRSDDAALMAAALHDLAADPQRWHGFDIWRIDGAWWESLQEKLGVSRNYQRLVRLPDDYDQKPGARWPLILFLHGSGERGNDLEKVKKWGPISSYLDQGHSLPFIVAAPQCPAGEWWDVAELSRLLDELEKTYRVDPKRIYVTGLSMGGYGTFDLAASYPERFAAIAPLSGGGNPALAERLRHMPTWIFHGGEDPVVPTRYSIDIADAMKRLGAPVKLTIYPGEGHGGWDKTYADPALYAWFLQHSR